MKLASLAAALILAGCALTDEQREGLRLMGQGLQDAGNAMKRAQPATHTYIFNGRVVTCTTTNNVTNCF